MPAPLEKTFGGEEIAERLLGFPAFRILTDDARGRLAELAAEVVLDEDQNLVQEGQEMDSLYLVVRGSLAVFRDAVGSPVVLLRRFYPGDYFGHVAFYGSGRHWATVRTSEKCVLLRIAKQDLLAFLAEHKDLAAALETAAAQRHSANLAAEIEVERGREVRMRLHHNVSLTLEDGSSLPARLENLSLGGFCLEGAPEGWQPETTARFGLELPAGTLQLAGRVAWRRHGAVGLQFTEMSSNHDLVIQLAIRLLLDSQPAPG